MFICLYLLFTGSLSPAAVIVTPAGLFVEGVVEGSLTNPSFHGDTIDYLTFEVTTTGPVRLIGTDLRHSLFLAIGRIIEVIDPGDERFLNLLPPYLLFPSPTFTPPELTHILDAGMYVIQVADDDYKSGDLGYDYIPVNRAGGGFVASPYTFTVEGAVTGIDFREGNLNGTFTVTNVPEPSAAALLCMAMAAGCFTRRGRRM